MIPALWAAILVQQFFATNTDLGYRFPLPDGFAPFPEAANRRQGVVACWTEPFAASPSGALVLCVQRMRTRLKREPMTSEGLPAYAQLVAYKWKGFDINGVRTDTVQAGQAMAVFVAQIPLRREAIQLIIGGPRDQASRSQAIMTSIIASLEGETNWLTSEERSGRWGNIVGWWVGIAIAAILVRMWRTRRAARAA